MPDPGQVHRLRESTGRLRPRIALADQATPYPNKCFDKGWQVAGLEVYVPPLPRQHPSLLTTSTG
jgi:hypothetical protein